MKQYYEEETYTKRVLKTEWCCGTLRRAHDECFVIPGIADEKYLCIQHPEDIPTNRAHFNMVLWHCPFCGEKIHYAD